MILHQQLLSGAAEFCRIDHRSETPAAPVAGRNAAPFQPALRAAVR